MRRVVLFLLVLCALPGMAAAQPYYVRGNFYCHTGVNDPAPGDSCWGWDAGNQMFDDGLHGDGASADGIWGATIACTQPGGRLDFKIATNDWSFAVPSSPFDPLANAVLFASGPGDLIHFILDNRFLPGGWQPFTESVATDHYLPAGVSLEVIGSAPEIGSWNYGIPLQRVGDRWQRFVTIQNPGDYEFKIRVIGTWDVVSFGYDYSNTAGRNVFFSTGTPNTDVFFQLDNATGRIRAIDLGPTAVKSTTWGRLKKMYR